MRWERSKLDWQVGRGPEVWRTDPYHGLQWETRKSWQVESWEGSLDSEGRWTLLGFRWDSFRW